jgi:hypothetical protein
MYIHLFRRNSDNPFKEWHDEEKGIYVSLIPNKKTGNVLLNVFTSLNYFNITRPSITRMNQIAKKDALFCRYSGEIDDFRLFKLLMINFKFTTNYEKAVYKAPPGI